MRTEVVSLCLNSDTMLEVILAHPMIDTEREQMLKHSNKKRETHKDSESNARQKNKYFFLILFKNKTKKK